MTADLAKDQIRWLRQARALGLQSRGREEPRRHTQSLGKLQNRRLVRLQVDREDPGEGLR